MAIIRFLVTLVFVGVLVAAISIVWPRITTLERPPLLTDVRNLAVSYPAGKSFAEVLDVGTEATSTTMVAGDITNMLATGVVKGVSDVSTKLIAQEASEQLALSFDKLPEEQKEKIRNIVCREE